MIKRLLREEKLGEGLCCERTIGGDAWVERDPTDTAGGQFHEIQVPDEGGAPFFFPRT